MILKNTCVACGTQFNSQQSSSCLRCILKNCFSTNTSLTAQVEQSDHKAKSIALPLSNTTDQPSLLRNIAITANQGTSKGFLAWQAIQSKRLLVSLPKLTPAPYRERFPAGSSPWKPPRIVSMEAPLGTVCILCGCRVLNMLEHKYLAHGEEPVVRLSTPSRKGYSWITFVSGGLPSLGKRSK